MVTAPVLAPVKEIAFNAGFIFDFGTSGSPQRFKDMSKSYSNDLARAFGVAKNFPSADSGYELFFNYLEKKFEIRNKVSIKEYLIRYPHLFSILEEAYSVIEEIFGRDTQVALEMVRDPEIEDYEQLFGYIKSDNLSPEDAFERLQVFDDIWYVDRIDLIGEHLNFNLE
jgi:hypothetical protein